MRFNIKFHRIEKIIFLAFLFLISFRLFAVIPVDTTQVAEKVYLHVDRSMYTSGEDIWFKAYVIDPSTNKLSPNTNNLHIELIAPESEIVQSRIIRVDNGSGHGDFSLPDSIPSGQYRIRAYTNHMRNYGDEKFFVKEIAIVDPNETDKLQLPVRKIDNRIDITFFPEGGSLIDNVTSTIGFKAVNTLGKGCDVTVKLYSSSGELITIFNSTHLGMGFFNLKPLTGYTYYTVVQGKDGTEIKAPIPASFPAGVAISTLITPDQNLMLTINTNTATLPSLIGKDLDVEVSLRNLVHKTIKLKFDSLVNNFLMPLADIPDGVLRVTLGVPDGLPLCERLVFLQRNQNERLIVTTDKIEYKPREKVTVTIALSGDSTLTDKGDFSMAVVEKRLSDSSAPYSRSITSWFLLESDVRGPVEDPGYYFDPDNEKRLQDLDLLLLTQGWRDFEWKYDTLAAFKHEMGFTISGQVKRILNNNPIPAVKINAAVFHMNTTEFMDARTDKDGKFRFEELEVYGKVRIFLSSTGKLENLQGKISVEPVSYNPPGAEKLQKDTEVLEIAQKELASYKQEASYRLNALKKYKLSDTISLGEVTITATKIEPPQEVKVRESRRIYTAPDKELIVLPTQESFSGDVFSYLSGRIPGVQVVRGIDKSNLFYPDDVQIFIRGQYSTKKKEDGSYVRFGALILLDGYELEDAGIGFVLSTPMNAIDRIDILNATPLYGMRGANGVINIITKVGLRREPVSLAPNSVYTSFQGFEVPRIFYSPKYDNKTELTAAPDYRSTIFWEPEINQNNDKKEVDFFNSDRPTEVNITVEGVAEKGIPLSCKTNYEVK
jgi:hypothetical protein